MALFNWFPRRNPSLPQNVNPAQLNVREARLADKANQYSCSKAQELADLRKRADQNDKENPPQFLAAIPMVEEVPDPDQPTLVWAIKAASARITVASNTLVDRLDGDRDVARAKQELEAIRKDVASLLDNDNSWVNLLRLRVQSLFSNPHQRTIKSLKKLIETIETDVALDISFAEDLIPYNTIFDTIELPEIAQTFSSDETFARLRVAGPNPMLIARLDKLPDNFKITETGFQKVMGTEDSLSEAFNEKRVFWLDYSAIAILADSDSEPKHTGTVESDPPGEWIYDKTCGVPMALFAVPKGGGSLKPVAIQCGQNPEQNPVIYAEPLESTGTDYWKWQAAKFCVQVADANYHEIFVHLARTHLVMEAFTLATHRCLAENHPLYILLVPHCEGTLFINNLATGDLIAPGGPIDKVFVAKIEYSQRAAAEDRIAFDFYNMLPPNDFRARNVDDPKVLKDFPYRDDALLIWDAIHNWVKTYVQVYYQNDVDVKNDSELVKWTEFLMEDGKINGFRLITSREQLIDVLSMIIFTASAQHAAVNFPQRTVMAYAPAFSAAIWRGDPNNTSSRQEWLKLLPPVSIAKAQLDTLYALGSVYYRKLGEYKSNVFPYFAWMQDPKITAKGGPLDQFQFELEKVEEEINRRNKDGRKEAYPFLLPSQIPPSINI